MAKEKTGESEIRLPEGVTDEHVKAWKERYGEKKVKYVELEREDKSGSFGCIIRAPGRKEISEYEKWMDKNPDKSKEILINSCVLTGKEIIKEDDEYFTAAVLAISNLIPMGSYTIKNL